MEQSPQNESARLLYDIIATMQNAFNPDELSFISNNPNDLTALNSELPPAARALYTICKITSNINNTKSYEAPDTQKHQETLKAAGVKFQEDLDGLTLVLEDPATYLAALQELPPSRDGSAYDNDFLRLNSSIAEEAITALTQTITLQGGRAMQAMYGGALPLANILGLGEAISARAMKLASHLPERATALGYEFERIGVPARIITHLRLLGLAHEEKLTEEWAIAGELDVLDYSESRVGIDRLASAPAWEMTYTLLNHLAKTAPRAAFTQALRNKFLHDINHALATPDTTVIPPVTDWLMEEYDITYDGIAEGRQQIHNQSEPLMREALRRIPQILP